MVKDLNAPLTRWKWMKISEHRKPFITIRPDDHVVSQEFIVFNQIKKIFSIVRLLRRMGNFDL